MKLYYITFRSVTFAQRGERVLTQGGYRCVIQRTPKWMESQGCGYALRVWTDEIETAMDLLGRSRVSIRKLYIQRQDGHLEEMKS